MATPVEAAVAADTEVARPTSTASAVVTAAEAATGEEQAAIACPTSEPVCRSRTGVSSFNHFCFP